jgi:hypothetical protein
MEQVRMPEGVCTVSVTANGSKQIMRVQASDAGELLSPVTKAVDCKVIVVRVKEPTLEDAYCGWRKNMPGSRAMKAAFEHLASRKGTRGMF